MKRKLISLLLIGILLSACGETAPQTETTAPDVTTSVPKETEPHPVLPDKTYEGRTFYVSLRDYGDSTRAFYLEEANGDVLDDAIYERMLNVSSLLDINFSVNYVAGDVDGISPITSVRAGEDAYQLILAKSRQITTFAIEGLCYDWNNLPYVDFEQLWWDGESQEKLNIGNKIYLVLDNLTHDNMSKTAALLFNRDMFDEYSIAYPYDMVREGTWTFDRMEEIAKNTAKDLNGDSKIDIANDQYGFVATGWGTPLSILYTAGQSIAEINSDGELEMTINTQRTVDVYDRFFSFMEGDHAYLDPDGGNADQKTAFRNGRVCFQEMGFGSIIGLRDMEQEFGIVPLPKFDESVDRYYCKVDAGCSGVMVPVTISDPEFVSAVIEAICYENNKLVIPAYFDTVLQGKAARDDDSIEMLEIIRDSRTFDSGYFMLGINAAGWPFADIGYFMTTSADHNFASHYAANATAALTLIDKINETYK